MAMYGKVWTGRQPWVVDFLNGYTRMHKFIRTWVLFSSGMMGLMFPQSTSNIVICEVGDGDTDIRPQRASSDMTYS